MKANGWTIDETFDFYSIPSFVDNPDERREMAHKALVQRLAFLYANRQLENLRICILDGLKDAISFIQTLNLITFKGVFIPKSWAHLD